jgi:hypothetical protein
MPVIRTSSGVSVAAALGVCLRPFGRPGRRVACAPVGCLAAALALRLGGGLARTSQPHDLHEAPGQHRVPQAIPGLDLGACVARVGPLPVVVCAKVLGEPISAPFLRGAPRRLGAGKGGNS